MMKRFDPRIIFGSLLLIGGGLALLQAMGYLRDASDIFWGSIFVLLGLLFLSMLLGGHWWSVFPGFTLLAIGVLIVLPDRMDDLGGLIFLGGIALAFWVTYGTAPQERWWALIPAGVLTTLAGMTVASERFGDFETAGFFFIGLAITFLLVALLAGMRWAYWPAAVLGIMGALGLASLFEIANYIWAVALMAAGVFLLFRYFTKR
jgi:hypothetical protein